MRCDMCPLCPDAEDDCCEISYSEFGIDHKDGMSGCKHPYNWAKKRADAYESQYQDCGEWYKAERLKEEQGIDVDDKDGIYVADAEHCIGLDYRNPYKRHGKLFYKAYRNYFNIVSDDKVWSTLAKIGYAKEYHEEFFCLTPAGIRWLQRILGIHKITIE